jgi:hypothetical protein
MDGEGGRIANRREIVQAGGQLDNLRVRPEARSQPECKARYNGEVFLEE